MKSTAFLSQYNIESLGQQFLFDITLKAILIVPLVAIAVALLRKSTSTMRHLVWVSGVILIVISPAVSHLIKITPLVVIDQNLLTSESSQRLPATEPNPLNAPWKPSRASKPITAISQSPATASIASEKKASSVAKRNSEPILASMTVSNAGEIGNSGSFKRIIALLWFIGAAGCLSLLAAFSFVFWRRSKHGRSLTTPHILQQKDHLVQRLGLIRRVKLVESKTEAMPMTWGTVRPTILLPASSANWTESRLRMVLLHELSHVRRYDSLWNTIALLAICIHWFNPLVWFAVRRLRAECEQACDDCVLSDGLLATDYASELLDLSTGGKRGALAMCASLAMAGPDRLNERIRAILDESRNRRLPSLGTILLGLFSTGLLLVPITLIAQVNLNQNGSREISLPKPPSQESQAKLSEPPAGITNLQTQSPASVAAPSMLAVRHAWTGKNSTSAVPSYSCITDRQNWTEIWNSHHRSEPFNGRNPHPVPDIDFSKFMVIAIAEQGDSFPDGIVVSSISRKVVKETETLLIHYQPTVLEEPVQQPVPKTVFGFFAIPRDPAQIHLRKKVKNKWKTVKRFPPVGMLEDDPKMTQTIPTLSQIINGFEPATSINRSPGNALRTPKEPAPEGSLFIGFAHDPGQGKYDGVVGRPDEVWNFVDVGTTAIDFLRHPNATPSTAHMRITRHDGEWGIATHQGIYRGYIYHNCQCVDLEVTLLDLAPSRYRAYVYAHGDAPDQNAMIEVVVGGRSAGKKATADNGTTSYREIGFKEGDQYVCIDFEVPAGEIVKIISHRDGSGYSMFNAIQLVPLSNEKPTAKESIDSIETPILR